MPVRIRMHDRALGRSCAMASPGTNNVDAEALWQGRAGGRRSGGPIPSADVAAVGPVPVKMWQGWAQSRCRCGSGELHPGRIGELSPGADAAGMKPGPQSAHTQWVRRRVPAGADRTCETGADKTRAAGGAERTFRRARMAYMPASVHTERMSAPVLFGQSRA